MSRLTYLFFSSKFILLLVVLVIASAGSAYYFYHKNQETLTLLNNPAQASEEEITELTGKVSKLMDLPTDEKPTIITVVDKEKLKDQSFFVKAENGDKVLVYAGAKKAIMFRPSTNKVVEVGPVQITPNQTFKVTMIKGSSSADLAAAESTLKERVTNLEYSQGGLASDTYTKTVVVDLKGDKSKEATQIAEFLGGSVSTLPAGETKPDADFLVIVGK